MLVKDFLPEFIEELEKQLDSDEQRWGSTWRQRGLKNQELRTLQRYRDYWDMYQNNNTPIPWLKVIGGALICWIREKHPEVLANLNDDCNTLDLKENVFLGDNA
jgi:chaperonin cofactor prefoldin